MEKDPRKLCVFFDVPQMYRYRDYGTKEIQIKLNFYFIIIFFG